MQKHLDMLYKAKNIDRSKFSIRPGFPDVANGIVFRCYFEVDDSVNPQYKEYSPLKVCLYITLSEIADSRDNPYISIKNFKAPTMQDAWAAKILTAIWYTYVDVILHKSIIDRPGKYYKLIYWFESQTLKRYWEED